MQSSKRLTLAIVRRSDDLHTFQVLPRRLVVERTLLAGSIPATDVAEHARTILPVSNDEEEPSVMIETAERPCR